MRLSAQIAFFPDYQFFFFVRMHFCLGVLLFLFIEKFPIIIKSRSGDMMKKFSFGGDFFFLRPHSGVNLFKMPNVSLFDLFSEN